MILRVQLLEGVRRELVANSGLCIELGFFWSVYRVIALPVYRVIVLSVYRVIVLSVYRVIVVSAYQVIV